MNNDITWCGNFLVKSNNEKLAEKLIFASNFGSKGYWWSSTVGTADDAWLRTLFFNYNGINRISNGKTNGFSVRCVRY